LLTDEIEFIVLCSKFNYLNQSPYFLEEKIGGPDGGPEGGPEGGPKGVQMGSRWGPQGGSVGVPD